MSTPHAPPIHRWSSLARPLDPRVPSNRWIVRVSIAAALMGTLYGAVTHGVSFIALLVGASAAVTAFLAWALGREIDPDDEIVAFLCVGLTMVGWMWFRGADLWTLGAAVVLARVVNRSVGPGAHATDDLLVLVFVGAAAWTGRWSLPLAATIAFAWDARLPWGERRHVGAAILAGGLFVLALIVGKVHVAAPPRLWLLVSVSLGYFFAIITTPRLVSRCDIAGFSLQHRRVQAGMVLAAVVAGLAQFEPSPGMRASGVLACMAAMVVGRALRARQA